MPACFKKFRQPFAAITMRFYAKIRSKKTMKHKANFLVVRHICSTTTMHHIRFQSSVWIMMMSIVNKMAVAKFIRGFTWIAFFVVLPQFPWKLLKIMT